MRKKLTFFLNANTDLDWLSETNIQCITYYTRLSRTEMVKHGTTFSLSVTVTILQEKRPALLSRALLPRQEAGR